MVVLWIGFLSFLALALTSSITTLIKVIQRIKDKSRELDLSFYVIITTLCSWNSAIFAEAILTNYLNIK